MVGFHVFENSSPSREVYVVSGSVTINEGSTQFSLTDILKKIYHTLSGGRSALKVNLGGVYFQVTDPTAFYKRKILFFLHSSMISSGQILD